MLKNKNLSLSLDIGGTKIRVIEYSPNYRILTSKVFKTNDFFYKKNIQSFFNLLTFLSKKYSKKYKVLGLSINAALKDNIIYYWSMIGGETFIDLKKELGKYFSFKEFYSDNDVICGAKAEIKFGVGKNSKSFTLINLGTGLRLVNVENNIILTGYKNLAGEVGLLPIHNNQEKNLPLEEILGGKFISTVYFNDKNKVNYYLTHLDYLLRLISLFYNPEYIVLAGGMTNVLKLFLTNINDNYKKFLPKFFRSKKIILSKLKYPSSLGAIISL